MDQRAATVWVETSAPCRVTVAGCHADTFQVSGHHYALVVVTGLTPGTATPYEVHLDGSRVWPLPGSTYPASRIRTLPDDTGHTQRIIFGSCRKPPTSDPARARALGVDALHAYATRMAGTPESEWPTALLMLGDQVYADETTTETRQWLARRRDLGEPPGVEVANFEEYVRLYHESWSVPSIRWLLSTVPTSMIFDDHDVHDDWNTSQAWRDEIEREPWWRERIRGAMVSYWVYQHLGNLSPDDLATDTMYRAVLEAGSGTDTSGMLREFADRADAEVEGAKGARWSYRKDFGRVRLLVVDTRSGRIFGDRARSMISDSEFEWIESNAHGDMDHLLIGSSLPWLLPHVIGDIEAMNEVACRRARRPDSRAEKLRQAIDLEHWPAFASSSARLARLVARIGSGSPATVCVLSGDVHHSYTARVRFPRRLHSRVHQLVCSPMHNTVPAGTKRAFAWGWSRPLGGLSGLVRRIYGAGAPPVRWRKTSGPSFGNSVATLHLRDRDATMTLECAGGTRERPELTAHSTVVL